MLRSLHIENIAVVERADVEFGEGLNVLTGETGAGKSIVIDALYAVVGARASRELVRTGAERALAAAVFDAAGAERWCEENGVEPESGELIVQRSVGCDGRSACRVNGMPVTAAQLRALGTLLVDIHGQNDGRQLLDESRHIDYLDAFSGADAQRQAYAEAYGLYMENEKRIRRLSIDEDRRRELLESLEYRVTELKGASLRAGEEAELEARSILLRNGERLRQALDDAYDALYGGDSSAVDLAGRAQAQLARAASYSAELGRAEESVRQALALLTDAAELVREFSYGLDFSEEEFDRVEGRLAALRRLERKFSAPDEAALIALYHEAESRLTEIEGSSETLEALYRERERLIKRCREAAANVTLARTRAGERLSERVEAQLRELSMPSVRFSVELTPVGGEPGFGPRGADDVRFLMSANAGENPGRISRIASGGELSRIMLALKTVFGQNDPVPTSIFDEIDTGVSGVAASRVAEKLAAIGSARQVLCVSHLPQLAAMAHAQYRIEKQERDGRAYTTVQRLDREGRRQELARLIGGDNVTDTTLASAEELLSAADKYKRELTKELGR